MNTHSILVHSSPNVSDTLIHLNYRETAPPTCQTTATIADPTAIMYPIKMALSFHVGSGMFDKLSGSAGMKMQHELGSFFVYQIREKRIVFFCVRTLLLCLICSSLVCSSILVDT